MPWTESRTRDEWLADVRRRGSRLRRRRQLAVALAGVFALVLPLSAAAGFLSGQPKRSVELTATGPGQRRDVSSADDVPPTTVEPSGPTALLGSGSMASDAVASGPARADDGAPGLTPTTAEVHARVAVIDGTPQSRTPGSVPPADDPVVRPPSTTAPPFPGRGSAGGAQTAQPSSAAGAPGTDALAACPAEALQIDVVPTKATFAPGEPVRGVGFVQTRAADGCLVAMPEHFRIEDVRSGKVLGTVAATSEFPNPVKAEPGRMYTSNFTWDAQDCSGPTCTPAPAGLYQAVAEWSGGSPYRGWGEFRIGA